MTSSIPLIRAAAIFPMIRWLHENGRQPRELLRAADLGYVIETAPEAPVPLLGAFAFFRLMGATEGPDIGVRSVGPRSLTDLGAFGRVVLDSSTPRDALQRAAAALPRYSTHELLTLRRVPGGVCVRAGWSIVLDDETMHLTQQFSAALIAALCLATGRPGAAPRRIRIRPHPVAGLGRLRPWFGAALAPAEGAMLEVELDDDVLDAPLAGDPTPAGAPPALDDWTTLRRDLPCSQSVRLLLRSMAKDPPVSVERLARSGGIGARSLQRRLAAEGTCVRRLLDETRRDTALGALPGTSARLASVAQELGYAGQSSLSRAVRRWTGRSPSRLRTAASRDPAAE